MKRRNKNWPSPFPGRMSLEATKPGFSFSVFVLCFLVFVYLGILGLLLFYVVSTSAIDCLDRSSPKWPITFREGR